MDRDTNTSLVIAEAEWMHIRLTRAYHRHFPEARGEGRSRDDAIAQLRYQLARALDAAPGRGHRDAIERALADVRSAARDGRPRSPVHPGASADLDVSTTHGISTWSTPCLR